MKYLSILSLVIAVTFVGVVSVQAGSGWEEDVVAHMAQCTGDSPPATIGAGISGVDPDGVWYGCLCESWWWWSCDNVNYYECCQQMVWNDDDPQHPYWQCMSGYYLTCVLPPGCDVVDW